MSLRIESAGNAAVGYDRFIGRYQSTVAIDFADFAGVEADQNFGVAPPQRVIDVGCGTGVLTGELLSRTTVVAAVDVEPDLVAACPEKYPRADVRQGRADDLPYADDQFDVVLATLPVGAARDPLRCLREFGRVTQRGGTIAISAWDLTSFEMYDVFWSAARNVDSALLTPRRSPTAEGAEVALHYTDIDDLAYGVSRTTALYQGFEDFWSSVSYSGSPTGAYLAGTSPEQRLAVREECRALVPEDESFTMHAQVMYARGTSTAR